MSTISTTYSYFEAHSRLESSGPAIGFMRIRFHIDEYNQCANIMMKGGGEKFEYLYDFVNFDDAWARLGDALENNRTVKVFELDGIVNEDAEISSAGYQCLETFYASLERNTCIYKFVLNLALFLDSGLPTLNLLRARFYERLKILEIHGDNNVTDNQSFILSSVLESITTPSILLDVSKCNFGFNGSAIRRIILACLKVEHLKLHCRTISECTVLASLLRDPRSNLQILSCNHLFLIDEECQSIIAASLVGNTTLRKIRSDGCLILHPFARLLCDALSIEHIHNSNHTLEYIHFRTVVKYYFRTVVDNELASFVNECVKLNRNPDKEAVIRQKIARYYFVGSFDVSPFVNMPISLLPKVIGLIKGENHVRQSAIFRMLRSIPDLCNLSGRCSGQINDEEDSLR